MVGERARALRRRSGGASHVLAARSPITRTGHVNGRVRPRRARPNCYAHYPFVDEEATVAAVLHGGGRDAGSSNSSAAASRGAADPSAPRDAAKGGTEAQKSDYPPPPAPAPAEKEVPATSSTTTPAAAASGRQEAEPRQERRVSPQIKARTAASRRCEPCAETQPGAEGPRSFTADTGVQCGPPAEPAARVVRARSAPRRGAPSRRAAPARGTVSSRLRAEARYQEALSRQRRETAEALSRTRPQRPVSSTGAAPSQAPASRRATKQSEGGIPPSVHAPPAALARQLLQAPLIAGLAGQEAAAAGRGATMEDREEARGGSTRFYSHVQAHPRAAEEHGGAFPLAEELLADIERAAAAEMETQTPPEIPAWRDGESAWVGGAETAAAIAQGNARAQTAGAGKGARPQAARAQPSDSAWPDVETLLRQVGDSADGPARDGEGEGDGGEASSTGTAPGTPPNPPRPVGRGSASPRKAEPAVPWPQPDAPQVSADPFAVLTGPSGAPAGAQPAGAVSPPARRARADYSWWSADFK